MLKLFHLRLVSSYPLSIEDCDTHHLAGPSVLSGKLNSGICPSEVGSDTARRNNSEHFQLCHSSLICDNRPAAYIDSNFAVSNCSTKTMIADDSDDPKNIENCDTCHLAGPPVLSGKLNSGICPAEVGKDAAPYLRGNFLFQSDFNPPVSSTDVGSRSDPAPSQMLLYYQNVGGINSMLSEYQLACNDACYDIYAFTETWLNDNTLSSQLFDGAYSVYRQDRSLCNSNKRSGGGVLLAVRSSLKSRLVKPPESSSVEQVWVAITAHDSTLFLCVIYIPPDRVNDGTLFEKHQASLSWIVSKMGPRDNIIILGDFNLRELSWLCDSTGFRYPDSTRSSIRPTSSILLDSYSTASLRQINGILNDNNRLLDLCFVSAELGPDCTVSQAPVPLVKKCRHHPPLLVSLTVTPLCCFRETTEDVFYDYGKADFVRMNAFLADLAWDEIISDCDADRAASTLASILLYSIDQFVPKRVYQQPPNPCWSNSDLKRLKRIKRSALRKHSKHRTDYTKVAYIRANSEYKMLNDHLYNMHQHQLQRRLMSNPKSFWRHVNNQRKESGLPSTMTDGTSDAESIADIAELFRSQFCSVFTDEHLSEQDITAATSAIPRRVASGLQLLISNDMVAAASKQMKSSFGCGPDGIPSIILKRCMNSLALPLAMVFNLSLTSGIFPTGWKDSFVFPVHKKGCKQITSNYRGIAALNATSKLFERIVLNFLIQGCSHSISPDQHGFMPKRSTTTNLTTFTSFLIREIELGHQVDAVYTDLSAAFDKMNHEIALAKFDLLGIDNNLLIWLRSYLTGRNMSVKIGDHISTPFSVTSGVPQGSHLGPFLFLLYMNDVNAVLRCLKLSYADDLKLYFTILEPKDALFLQQQLEVFADWCRINRMSLNVSKCSVISFGRKRSLFEHVYALNGISLIRNSTVKDLGVMLDTKMTFKDHVNYIVSKASSQLGFICRFAKKFRDIYCLKALYSSLVRPILEYSSVVWSPFYQNGIYRIEAVQRRFVRFALRRLPWRDPLNLPSYESRCMLISLEILEARRNVAKACFVGDLLQGHIDCSTLLGLLDINTRRRNLRSHAFLTNNTARTNYGLHEPIRSMSRVFNTCYNVFDFNVSRDVNKSRFRSFLC